MTTKKITGSYYTPDHIAGFILDYTIKNISCNLELSILEPSVGDGAFIKAFNKSDFSTIGKNIKFEAIDLVENELAKAKHLSSEHPKDNVSFTFTTADFLELQQELRPEYHMIVGNPPYISKRLLSETQINLCEGIHINAGLSSNSIKNIWSSFLVRCTQLLTEDGILAFMLPAEMLQVSFSDELRTYVGDSFARVEIFTFNELLFDCKGQDTILLIGYKQHNIEGQFYTHIGKISELINYEFKLRENKALSINNTKWSHHILDSQDLSFVYELAARLHSIDHYCESKPGIVTAANSFFIINDQIENQFHLHKFAQPIIQKGFFVNGSVVFDQNDLYNLQKEGRPTKILVFNDSNAKDITDNVKDYLKIGEDLGIPLRYKCAKRKTWYNIPNISNAAEGFFFKRSHNYPKLLKNNAGVLVTDSAYKIQMKEGYAINNLVYSFYNSFTLLFAELDGRYYGGGVLELVPSEFKKLPLPYLEISEENFDSFTTSFENKQSISDILKMNDEVILGKSMGLSEDEINKIQLIYRKLLSKRLRN